MWLILRKSKRPAPGSNGWGGFMIFIIIIVASVSLLKDTQYYYVYLALIGGLSWLVISWVNKLLRKGKK